MRQRNNGQAEDDLQFRFTAYLVSAVKRRRKDYLIRLYKHRLTRAHREKQLKTSCQALHNAPPNRT